LTHSPGLVLAIVGQTATGKTGLAVEIAQEVGGEIINADAMALYRGMDIGTAKITAAEAQATPHHLFDVLEVTQEASVAVYQQHARDHIDRVLERGKTPIVVGGSGLYVRAALDHIDFPPTDPAVRAELYTRVETEGLATLYGELQRVDPAAAATIQPRNDRRIVRALEVISLTGKPFSASLPRPQYVYRTVQIAIRVDQSDLDQRIEQRVGEMWEAGLVEEVRQLMTRGLAQGPTASRAVGYAETMRHLAGELDAEETQELIAQSTRQLARRQRRWFARDPRITYISAPARLADALRVIQMHESKT